MENKVWKNSGNIRVHRNYNNPNTVSFCIGKRMNSSGWSRIPLPFSNNHIFILFLNTLKYYNISKFFK